MEQNNESVNSCQPERYVIKQAFYLIKIEMILPDVSVKVEENEIQSSLAPVKFLECKVSNKGTTHDVEGVNIRKSI